jgi:hypothetical protein
MQAAAEAIVREVKHRLANRYPYYGHGASFAEGLWRDTSGNQTK